MLRVNNFKSLVILTVGGLVGIAGTYYYTKMQNRSWEITDIQLTYADMLTLKPEAKKIIQAY